jgi:hypothetical protein
MSGWNLIMLFGILIGVLCAVASWRWQLVATAAWRKTNAVTQDPTPDDWGRWWLGHASDFWFEADIDESGQPGLWIVHRCGWWRRLPDEQHHPERAGSACLDNIIVECVVAHLRAGCALVVADE